MTLYIIYKKPKDPASLKKYLYIYKQKKKKKEIREIKKIRTMARIGLGGGRPKNRLV